MSKDYRTEINIFYNRLLNNGFKLPDNLNPDVNGLILCINALNVINPDKLISVGSLFCNLLNKVTKYHLEKELKIALATKNEILARACYNKLIQISNSNQGGVQNLDLNDEKTKVPCVPKRFVFAERLLKETVFKFKGNEGNGDSNTCNNDQTDGIVQQNLDNSRNKLSFNSNNQNQLQNESEYSSSRVHTNEDRIIRKIPTKSKSLHGNYLYKTDKNPTFDTDNRKNPKPADLLIKNKSNYDLQPFANNRSKSMKIFYKNEKIINSNAFLDKVNSQVESKKNDKNVSNNSRNIDSRMNKREKKNEKLDKIQKKNSKNDSKGMVTPVKRVSKVSQKIINSIELFQKKRQRESVKDNSTCSIQRPRSKKRRIDSNIIEKSIKSPRHIIKNVDSDVKSYNSYNCSNNILTDASGCTLLSTPVSTYSYRGDKKKKVFRRRNLFSTPRRHK